MEETAKGCVTCLIFFFSCVCSSVFHQSAIFQQKCTAHENPVATCQENWLVRSGINYKQPALWLAHWSVWLGGLRNIAAGKFHIKLMYRGWRWWWWFMTLCHLMKDCALRRWGLLEIHKLRLLVYLTTTFLSSHRKQSCTSWPRLCVVSISRTQKWWVAAVHVTSKITLDTAGWLQTKHLNTES